MFLRVPLISCFLLACSLVVQAQAPRRLPNPIVTKKRNPNAAEPSQNPVVTESDAPVVLRQTLPNGLVYVHQTVDLPQSDDALMTIDGEPLPATKVNNVTLGIIIGNEGLIVARLVGVLPSQPPRDLKVYTMGAGRALPAQFLGMDAVTELCVLKVDSEDLKPVAAADVASLPVIFRGKMWGFHPQQGQSRSNNFSLTRPRINQFTAQANKATNDFRYSSEHSMYYLTAPQLTLVQDGSVITTNDNKVFGVAVYDITNETRLVYPLTRIKEIAAKIVATKDSLAYGWLGATGRDLPSTINTQLSVPKPQTERGVWVDGVFPESPAEEAGIRVRDILLSINERPVESRAQLASVLRQLPPDSQVTIRLKRENEYKIVKAKLVPLATDPQQLIGKLLQRLEAWKSQLKALPNTDPLREKLEAKVVTMDAIMKGILSAPAPPDVKLRVFYGLEIQPTTEALLQHFAAPNGVLISTVNENSKAAQAGLQAGDVVTQIGERKITDVASFLQALDAAEGKIQISVVRQRANQLLTLSR